MQTRLGLWVSGGGGGHIQIGDEQLKTRGEVVVKNQRPELNTDSGGVGGSDSGWAGGQIKRGEGRSMCICMEINSTKACIHGCHFLRCLR